MKKIIPYIFSPKRSMLFRSGILLLLLTALPLTISIAQQTQDVQKQAQQAGNTFLPTTPPQMTNQSQCLPGQIECPAPPQNCSYQLDFVNCTCGQLVCTSPTVPTKRGDLNGDNKTDIFDLSILLSNWNKTGSTGDLNSDGIVNIYDLSILLTNWG